LLSHIIELWWDSNGWHHNDLTIAACVTVAPESEPRGYAFEGQGTQHVIYRGTDDHIHELWWGNTVWNQNDLTTAAGAPLAKGLANGGSTFGPAGYMFNAQGTQHVNYLGQDLHIHELWWDSNGWHHTCIGYLDCAFRSAAAHPKPINTTAAPRQQPKRPRRRMRHGLSAINCPYLSQQRRRH
jgi:hypothetical protein